jgi:hypothetical protein
MRASAYILYIIRNRKKAKIIAKKNYLKYF